MKAKICGVKDEKTLRFILDHKYPPDFIGFISNFPKSKRFIEIDKLKYLTDINKKNHKIFKLASLCAMNGFPIKDSHTAKADTLGLKNLTEYLKKNDNELFNKNLQFINKKDVLPYVKNLKYFYTTETFFSKSLRPFNKEL